MTERIVTVDGVDLCVDTTGAAGDPAVLLIGGIGASMDGWDPVFCELLAAPGRYVVRYDHRDTGRSSSWPRGAPGYTDADLTTDPLRVLDGLGIDRAHLVGISMGGGIAQDLAARSPERVRTLTLLSTSCAGERADASPLPPPVVDWPDLVLPAADDRDAVLAYLLTSERAFTGTLPRDEDRARRVVERAVDRSADLAGASGNHEAAMAAGGGSTPFRMDAITAPTLVLHGTADPLFPFPHGEALAAAIPGARLVPLDGVGHEVPPPALWDLVVAEITAHTR